MVSGQGIKPNNCIHLSIQTCEGEQEEKELVYCNMPLSLSNPNISLTDASPYIIWFSLSFLICCEMSLLLYNCTSVLTEHSSDVH